MSTRLARAALLVLAVALPAGAAVPALAGPAQSYVYREQRFRNACPPPLKFAAGACVRRCPAGYQNMGGYCRLRSMRW
ncbi:hypothetical protein [Methylobacterium nigriterrae]|uniref:hypothetical protein n=1 Tax=Methylobacterium nigriterrae TaxID=3127512 RepID=UPI003013BC9D